MNTTNGKWASYPDAMLRTVATGKCTDDILAKKLKLTKNQIEKLKTCVDDELLMAIADMGDGDDRGD